jgi:hypothetical protein
LARLVILLAIAAGVVVLLHWFTRTPPEKLKGALRRGALWGAIAVVVALAATGRLNWVFALLAAAVPLVQRLLTLLQVAPLIRRLIGTLRGHQAGATAHQPRSSTVTTRFLRMELAHDTGALSGEVLDGPYRGRELTGLELAELLQLLRLCRAQDPQSAALLEAYLDRVRGPEWRNLAGAEGAAAGPATGGRLSRTQACEILGVAPDAAPDEIRSAHRRLMQKVHPDRGGSTYLAALINQAKDVLLGER